MDDRRMLEKLYRHVSAVLEYCQDCASLKVELEKYVI